MISCQSCGHESPLGATFCRGCGKRLVVDYETIEKSVQGNRVSDRDHAVLRSGRSALMLCTFALVCALIARYVVVPPMPATVPPPTPILEVLATGPPGSREVTGRRLHELKSEVSGASAPRWLLFLRNVLGWSARARYRHHLATQTVIQA